MIFLRKLQEDDLKIILNWKKKKEYLNKEHSLTMEFEKNWFANVEIDECCKYWVINSGTIKIGIAGINHIDVKDKSCNVECIIEEKHFRNRGINQIVISNLLEYAFDEVNMEKVYIKELGSNNIFSENEYAKYIEGGGSGLFSKKIEFFGQEFILIDKTDWKKFGEHYLLDRIDID
ncbi:MAG TPA: hypothetical protein DG753_08680 [Clostridium sp.]|nr:hypothetical protein [Clostridium sp.]